MLRISLALLIVLPPLIIIDIDCKAVSDIFLKAGLPKNENMYIFDKTSHVAVSSGEHSGQEQMFFEDDFFAVATISIKYTEKFYKEFN